MAFVSASCRVIGRRACTPSWSGWSSPPSRSLPRSAHASASGRAGRARGASRAMNSRHLTGHAVHQVALDAEVGWQREDYFRVAAATQAAAHELEVPVCWGAAARDSLLAIASSSSSSRPSSSGGTSACPASCSRPNWHRFTAGSRLVEQFDRDIRLLVLDQALVERQSARHALAGDGRSVRRVRGGWNGRAARRPWLGVRSSSSRPVYDPGHRLCGRHRLVHGRGLTIASTPHNRLQQKEKALPAEVAVSRALFAGDRPTLGPPVANPRDRFCVGSVLLSEGNKSRASAMVHPGNVG